MQKKPSKKMLIILLAGVFLLGLFISSQRLVRLWRMSTIYFLQGNNEQEQKLSYIYDDINQVVGNMEIAKKMTEGSAMLDGTRQEVKGVSRGIMMVMDYKYSGMLIDVTSSTSSGLAKANFGDNEYNFYATLANLREPINGDYYEGWLVRKDPFGFVSTGKIEKIGGEYINLYKSNMDLRDYNLYVVTMEENNGNSASAKHVLEGVLKK